MKKVKRKNKNKTEDTKEAKRNNINSITQQQGQSFWRAKQTIRAAPKTPITRPTASHPRDRNSLPGTHAPTTHNHYLRVTRLLNLRCLPLVPSMCPLYLPVCDREAIDILVRPDEIAFFLADIDKFRANVGLAFPLSSPSTIDMSLLPPQVSDHKATDIYMYFQMIFFFLFSCWPISLEQKPGWRFHFFPFVPSIC